MHNTSTPKLAYIHEYARDLTGKVIEYFIALTGISWNIFLTTLKSAESIYLTPQWLINSLVS